MLSYHVRKSLTMYVPFLKFFSWGNHCSPILTRCLSEERSGQYVIVFWGSMNFRCCCHRFLWPDLRKVNTLASLSTIVSDSIHVLSIIIKRSPQIFLTLVKLSSDRLIYSDSVHVEPDLQTKVKKCFLHSLRKKFLNFPCSPVTLLQIQSNGADEWLKQAELFSQKQNVNSCFLQS